MQCGRKHLAYLVHEFAELAIHTQSILVSQLLGESLGAGGNSPLSE